VGITSIVEDIGAGAAPLVSGETFTSSARFIVITRALRTLAAIPFIIPSVTELQVPCP
jgi:hypothetical protein